VLGGIVGARLSHPDVDAVCDTATEAAWVHDRAGALAATRRGGARGATLNEVLDALGDAWPRTDAPPPPYPALVDLPAVLG
jgi:NAD(P)H-hydrate repair Nnr-like enzyme with NAD(P)H-hydrate dehydratase domain